MNVLLSNIFTYLPYISICIAMTIVIVKVVVHIKKFVPQDSYQKKKGSIVSSRVDQIINNGGIIIA